MIFVVPIFSSKGGGRAPLYNKSRPPAKRARLGRSCSQNGGNSAPGEAVRGAALKAPRCPSPALWGRSPQARVPIRQVEARGILAAHSSSPEDNNWRGQFTEWPSPGYGMIGRLHPLKARPFISATWAARSSPSPRMAWTCTIHSLMGIDWGHFASHSWHWMHASACSSGERR